MSTSPSRPGRGLLKYSVVMPVASSSKMVGPLSANGEFTTHPRFSGGSQPKSSRLSWRRETNRSAAPQPPRPVLWKYSLWPSVERLGTPSFPAELMFGPRSTGSPQGASMLARCETQMSAPPRPPGREPGGEGRAEEVMYRLRPSLEIAGLLSLYGELTTGPRFTGADQGPYRGGSSPSSAADGDDVSSSVSSSSDDGVIRR